MNTPVDNLFYYDPQRERVFWIENFATGGYLVRSPFTEESWHVNVRAFDWKPLTPLEFIALSAAE